MSRISCFLPANVRYIMSNKPILYSIGQDYHLSGNTITNIFYTHRRGKYLLYSRVSWVSWVLPIVGDETVKISSNNSHAVFLCTQGLHRRPHPHCQRYSQLSGLTVWVLAAVDIQPRSDRAFPTLNKILLQREFIIFNPLLYISPK